MAKVDEPLPQLHGSLGDAYESADGKGTMVGRFTEDGPAVNPPPRDPPVLTNQHIDEPVGGFNQPELGVIDDRPH